MKRPKPDADLARWCEALTTTSAPDIVPDGWLTSRQIGKLLGKSESRTAELLVNALNEGRCERKMFRIPAAGTVRPVPHYRLK